MRAGIQLPMLFAAMAACGLVSSIALAQTETDPLLVSLVKEKAAVENRLATLSEQETKDIKVLAQCQSALLKAEHADRPDAVAVAQKAVSKAESALAKVRAQKARCEARLANVERARQWRVVPHLQIASEVPKTEVPAKPVAVENKPQTGGYGAVMVMGEVLKKTASGWVPYDVTKPLLPGDEIETGPMSYAQIIFSEGSKVDLGPNSGFRLEKLSEDTSSFDRIEGIFHATIDCLKKLPENLKRSQYDRVECGERRFQRQGVAMSVRGTEFDINAPPDGSTALTVLSGVVEIQNARTGKAATAKAGETMSIAANGVMGEVKSADLKAFVHWWEDEK